MSNSVTLWTVAHQAPWSMEFSRQEYWSGLPFLSPMGSSQPRDQTCISFIFCIGRWILYHYATWESLFIIYAIKLLVVLICNSLLTTMRFVSPYLYPLQYFCLENSMDRRSWQAIVQGNTKSRTWLSTHTLIYNWHIMGCISLRCTMWWFDTCAAKSLQPCPTLCNPIDSSPPGFPGPGIL